MTSCLNHDYLILIIKHFPYVHYENPLLIMVSAQRIFFDKILVSEYKLFKRSNKANLMTFQEIRIIVTGPCIANQLRNMQDKLVYCCT